MSKDQGLLIEVVDNMNEMVFGDYVARKGEPLLEIIRGGILDQGMDWLNTPKPTGESHNRFPNNRAVCEDCWLECWHVEC